MLDLSELDVLLNVEDKAEITLRVENTSVVFLCDSGTFRTQINSKPPGINKTHNILVRLANGQQLLMLKR